MKAGYAPYAGRTETYKWNLNPLAMDSYIVERPVAIQAPLSVMGAEKER